ncbi:LOW QUALITY PROTEIN: L-2-hydroxyglutarate dehydrogenase, mitochondrial-like [Rhipicephalus sanguineus]|uniref:LOW QUALITY PROTEIN: L-2-hydroxyglutarate dehydrogenase, mitochondrial-like n=1 Tax=Rhipicephalus sanguineus TaxID=34632 RepID=UPI0020C5A75B|nr:LOW QUALITY PROTEIN: L-2-hydroxyglutarate dehydrogenase, mitochondrial-like [Rhipicephalus sanguineus]
MAAPTLRLLKRRWRRSFREASVSNFYSLRSRSLLPSECIVQTSRCMCLYSDPAEAQKEYDVVIVGGGIVGVATARELSLRHPKLKLAIVEKENKLAAHQSGHNSGVIHAGIYYTPGSLKAKLCVRGLDLSYKYFDDHNIPYKNCSQLIVAVEPDEVPRLDVLEERGIKNGVKDLKRLDSREIKSVEPNCTGLQALWSPHTGIVDWGEVTQSYGRDFLSRGGDVVLNFPVRAIETVAESQSRTGGLAHPVRVVSDKKAVRCRYIVTCGGLYSDKLAALSGCNPEPKIVPFRGEYLLLKPEKADLVRANIYPVPDPRFPFLGVHYTPRIDGSVLLGPNAVLAFRREGYGYFDIHVPELVDALAYRGFRKLVGRNMSYAWQELYRGVYIRAQVKQLQKYIPQLQFSDVSRGPSGVRAQALDRDGNLVDDFVFDSGEGELAKRTLHVRNAPSPAATSSLAIAEMIADKVQETFQL